MSVQQWTTSVNGGINEEQIFENLLSVIFVLWICAFQIFAYDREDLDHY